MEVESALQFASPEEIYTRVFQEMRPRTPLPSVHVEFRRYANANAQIKLHEGRLTVRMADTLAGAPQQVMEALAEILLCKLFRRPVPKACNERYRRYLNGREMRRSLTLVRQIRGRKRLADPQGSFYNLQNLFEELNFRYFHGLLAQPVLGWSVQRSRSLLGHYDVSHNAIVLNCVLDQEKVPRLVVEYVLYHEMLHLRYPAENRGTRRCVHTREFKEAERQFEGWAQAQKLLRHL